MSDEQPQAPTRRAEPPHAEPPHAEPARTEPGRAGNKRRSDRDGRKLEPQIGRALRSVYDQTVGEDIPPEMLELLGKLD